MCCSLIVKFDARGWGSLMVPLWLMFSSTSEETIGKKGSIVTVVHDAAVCLRVIGFRESSHVGIELRPE